MERIVIFAGVEFLFRFLPIFLIIYSIVPVRYKNAVLLLGSILFYSMGEPYYVILLLFSVWVNHIFARQISVFNRRNYKFRDKKKKHYLWAAVSYDVLLLAVFKTLSVFSGKNLLPLGLSFYTFKMISFQADVYRREIKKVPSFVKTAAYFCMFPQIISGPIMRYNESGLSAYKRARSAEQLEEGIQYFAAGLGIKVLLADRLAILWNDIGMIGFESISTPLAWLGAAGYSMQLYFDFWGYSLMASGMCVMLGFPFIENFRHPYASRSVSEFWRRWHITLGAWFRDYIYIPLGGSRGGREKTVRNLLIVWILTGVWHGGGLNFLMWALFLFVVIAAEKLWIGKRLEKVPVIGHIYVLLLVPVTWILFAVPSLPQAGVYLGRMFPLFGGEGIVVNTGDFLKYLKIYGIFFGAGAALLIPGTYEVLIKHRKNPVVILFLTAVFWLSVYFIVSASSNPFMYFKF